MHTATPRDLQSPIRYARRGCPRLKSHRGASAPCCTGGGRRLMPTGLSLCLALDDAGLHLNQLTHREQGPAPISSPMKLHQGLIFAFSRVFANPVQPALLPGSPRTDGFHVFDYRSHSRVGDKAESPQGRDKEECQKSKHTSSAVNSRIPHITPVSYTHLTLPTTPYV